MRKYQVLVEIIEMYFWWVRMKAERSFPDANGDNTICQTQNNTVRYIGIKLRIF